MKQRLSPHPRCPGEAALEAWAIRDARGRPFGRGTLHLEQCPACRELHDRFVRFYRAAPRGGGLMPPQGRSGRPRLISGDVGLLHPLFHTLRPFDAGAAVTASRKPVALAGPGLAPIRPRMSEERVFLSADGSIRARRLDPDSEGPAWLDLSAVPPCVARRALVLLPGEELCYQSDDRGLVPPFPKPPPHPVDRIEVVPPAGRADYAGGDGREMLPPEVVLDAGAAGTILIEQEEDDGGESVLGVCLSGIPPSMSSRRLFVGLSPGGGAAWVEEAIGREAYFYGPDLFSALTVWVYVR